MKHTVPVTAVLVGLFLLSQLVGLGLINLSASVEVDEQGNRLVKHADTALGERPDTEGFASFTYLVIGLAVGTIVLLVIIRFALVHVWKLWYFLAVWAACIVSLGALIPRWPAVVVALALAIWKIWRPNVWIHNATEVLVYSGIALLIVPIFNLIWVTALLLLVSAYDAYAVWRSRHMVAMAQFQTDSKLFAGLFVPYERGTKMQRETSMKVRAVRKPAKEAPRESRNAILGGGDIAFPMLFAGVVLDELLQRGLSKVAAFGYSFIVVVVAAAALLLLFTYAKKDRFYPAMPFLTAGCLVGYGIMWLFL